MRYLFYAAEIWLLICLSIALYRRLRYGSFCWVMKKVFSTLFSFLWELSSEVLFWWKVAPVKKEENIQ